METPLIAIINHSEEFRARVEVALHGAGYQTIADSIDDAAVDVICRERPAAIVLELRSDAMEAARKVLSLLKDDPLCRNIPIVMSSMQGHVARTEVDAFGETRARHLDQAELDSLPKMLAALLRTAREENPPED